MAESSKSGSVSRRNLLEVGLKGAAAGLLVGGLDLAMPNLAAAQDVSTPDAAFAELVAGNKRFVSNKLSSNLMY